MSPSLAVSYQRSVRLAEVALLFILIAVVVLSSSSPRTGAVRVTFRGRGA
jgi:hypothetical protein